MKLWGVITTSFLLSSMLIGCTATTTAEPEELPPVEVEAAPTPTAELYIRETITPEEVEAPTPEPTPTPEPEVEEVVTDEAPDAEPEPAPVEEALEEAPEPDDSVEDSQPTDTGADSGEVELGEESPEAEPVNTEPARSYYGTCRITFYCPCSACCGSWGNATASGATPTAGWTVANGSLPFGTQVVIDGHTYCVEDRGVGSDQFDIYVDSHQEALNRGLYYTDVYILE